MRCKHAVESYTMCSECAPKPQAAPREIRISELAKKSYEEHRGISPLRECYHDFKNGFFSERVPMIERSAYDALEAENAELRLAEDARWRPTVAKLHMEIAQLKEERDLFSEVIKIKDEVIDLQREAFEILKAELVVARELIGKAWDTLTTLGVELETDHWTSTICQRSIDELKNYLDARENKS